MQSCSMRIKQLITCSGTVHGYASNAAHDIEGTMNFTERHGIRPIDTMTMTDAAGATSE